MTTIHIGIDPGARPCVALLNTDGASVITCRDMAEARDQLMQVWLATRFDARIVAALEKPPPKVFLPGRAARDGKGLVFSQEKLYRSLGRLEGMLMMLDRVEVVLVVPKTWQKGIPGVSAPSGPARKRQLAEHTRRLFPGVKATQENADALLIADWARRQDK